MVLRGICEYTNAFLLNTAPKQKSLSPPKATFFLNKLRGKMCNVQTISCELGNIYALLISITILSVISDGSLEILEVYQFLHDISYSWGSLVSFGNFTWFFFLFAHINWWIEPIAEIRSLMVDIALTLCNFNDSRIYEAADKFSILMVILNRKEVACGMMSLEMSVVVTASTRIRLMLMNDLKS
ncbi:uncharacterized protein LOC129752536 [Uranotaenia lowii]|uniref:uncharacterized protein LOC129752536 n=1 Tax=Uranotaenia lowii TaxID=190385 RepID=UPI002478FF76|nr:uncharacterized protein LOC129752536 [Uranotaenia lowii]